LNSVQKIIIIITENRYFQSKKEMSKIVIVVTNNSVLGKSGKQTGYYLPEVAHPYDVFTKNGFKVDFASPLGGYAPVDEGSVREVEKDKLCMEFHNDPKMQEALKNTKKIEDLKASDYVALFIAGGHGPVFDIPQHEPTQKLASDVYKNGGVVSALCHGPAGLCFVKVDGEYLVKGKHVTGFSNTEEDIVKLTEFMPFSLEDTLKKHGAIYEKSEGPFKGHVCISERLVTGQNPASAVPCAEAVCNVLKQK